MAEQYLNDNELEVTHELWKLASEADRSLKAAFFDINAHDRGVHVMKTETRRDIRRAAVDQAALMSFLNSGRYHWPPPRDDETDEATYSNLAATSASFLMGSGAARRMHQHLNFADLGTDQEPLFLDRYTTWLKEPGQLIGQPPHLEQDAQIVRWHIQSITNFYALQVEDKLR